LKGVGILFVFLRLFFEAKAVSIRFPGRKPGIFGLEPWRRGFGEADLWETLCIKAQDLFIFRRISFPPFTELWGDIPLPRETFVPPQETRDCAIVSARFRYNLSTFWSVKENHSSFGGETFGKTISHFFPLRGNCGTGEERWESWKSAIPLPFPGAMINGFWLREEIVFLRRGFANVFLKSVGLLPRGPEGGKIPRNSPLFSKAWRKSSFSYGEVSPGKKPCHFINGFSIRLRLLTIWDMECSGIFMASCRPGG